jgi:actin related protein 2/3 complex subunit 1A/1B
MSGEARLSRCVSCFAFNKDRTQCAVSPNDNTIEIYQVNSEDNSKWKLLHKLEEHDSFVADIDWSPVTNLIVSAGHDRNAYVWTPQQDGSWKPTLVILRINRAANSVRWSPNGDKFAVCSGAKVVPICHYEAQNDWWVSKMIKKHKSTVLSVSWHPNNKFILTGGCDFRCRLFSAFIEEVDSTDDAGAFGSIFPDQFKFGSLLAEFDQARGWVESVAWAPGGYRGAFVGHDSSINFIDLSSGQPQVQRIDHAGLPFTQIGFLSDDYAIAIGHEPNPMLFSMGSGGFEFSTKLDKKVAKSSGPEKTSRFGAAKNLFMKATSQAIDVKANQATSTTVNTRHQNQVTMLRILDDSRFATSGHDGRVLFWNMAELMK